MFLLQMPAHRWKKLYCLQAAALAIDRDPVTKVITRNFL